MDCDTAQAPKQVDLPLDDPERIEPVMPEFIDCQPVPAPPVSPDRVDDILRQIFKLIGQKLTREDPVVVAAPLQTACLTMPRRRWMSN